MRLSLRQVFLILLFLGLFLMTLRPISDPDFWWHLRTGQLIAQDHMIPHQDPFSFTKLGEPWVAHEWLSELILYALFKLGGYGLLIFAFSLIITGAFILTYLRCPQESKPYIAGFTLLLGALATAPAWGVRPQMLSLLLTSIFLFLLDGYHKTSRINWLVPIPIITLLWVNLHAGYFLGLAIIGIYITGDLIKFLIAKGYKTKIFKNPDLRRVLILCVVFLISILSTILNPNGIRILLYPFQTLTSQAMQQFIYEWFSPDFHLLEWQPLVWFLLAFIGAGMLGKKPLAPTRIILTLFFGYAALHSMRHVPLFIIVTIPILAEMIDNLVKVRPKQTSSVGFLKWLLPLIPLCALLLTEFRFVQVVRGQAVSETETFPKKALDWISTNRPEGALFNSYNWGGYIIWRQYPDYPVFIDGRADVYGDEFIYVYQVIYRGETGWEKSLDDYAINLVLVEPGSGLAAGLRQSASWKIIFEDHISTLFSRK
jgi:hypothetical protein